MEPRYVMRTDLSEIDKIVKVLKDAQRIYIIGDGGCAAQADHLACDLVKNAGKKAFSLCTNFALASAISNDINWNIVFSEQLKVYFDFKHDVLICLSTSGESRNLVLAAEYISQNSELSHLEESSD